MTPTDKQIDLFWAKVDHVGEPGRCWPWTRYVKSNGYATFTYKIDGRLYAKGAHRLAYESARGPIPEGMTIDHLCGNRICCNPAHLEAVTRGENNLRGNGPAALNARKTHCGRGHALEGDNLYVHRGKRSCVTCKRVATRAYRARAAA